MKITKRQLRRIIKEEIATVTDDKIKDVVMGVLSDEGGAAGIEPIQDELEDLEDDDISLPDESMEDIIGDVPGVKRHADGDYIDTTQLESRRIRITKSQLQKIIREACGDQVITFIPDEPEHGHKQFHYGEGSMASYQLNRIEQIASELQEIIHKDDDLDEWVEAKITKAQDYLSTVLNYKLGKHGQ